MGYRAEKLVIDARTDGRAQRQTQATTKPEGQNWPRVKLRVLKYCVENKTNDVSSNGIIYVSCSGSRLVLLGKKPSPEPMLFMIHDAIWRR